MSSTPTAATSPSRPALFSSPAADTTEYVFDALDRKIAQIDPATPCVVDGVAETVSPTTTCTFDAAGNMVSSTDPNGNTTRWVYDLEGRQTETTDALGDTTTTVFDAAGNVLASTDALGATTFFVYDTMNRKIGEIAPVPLPAVGVPPLGGGEISPLPLGEGQGEGNGQGEGGGEISPLPLGEGQGVRAVCVPGLGQVILAGGPITTWSYDADGNVLSVTDPLGNTTWTACNACNLPISVTDALGVCGRSAAHDAYDLHGAGAGFHGDRSPGADHRVPLR